MSWTLALFTSRGMERSRRGGYGCRWNARFIGLFCNLLLQFLVLEVVTEGDIEIKSVGALGEANAHKRVLARTFVKRTNHKVPGWVCKVGCWCRHPVSCWWHTAAEVSDLSNSTSFAAVGSSTMAIHSPESTHRHLPAHSYLLESLQDSTATPGNSSTGHCTNNSPVD